MLALSGCADYSQLAFTTDDRLTFRSPAPRSRVTLPVTLSWSDRSPRQGEGYAVFVDRAPVRPGHTMLDVAGRDAACQRIPTCPDPAYLADRGVYVTSRPSLPLTRIAPTRLGKGRDQLHEVVVVLVDADGRRVGESAWFLQFTLTKGAPR